MSIERAPRLEALVAGVIADLGLPARLAVAMWGPLPDTPYPLDPSLEADMATMSLRRRIGFSAGRAAIDRARRALDLPATPVPIGPGGAPMWPLGITGSISHTDALACAIVMVEPADQSDTMSIGIDLEQLGRVGDDLVSSIMTEAELRAWQTLDPGATAHGATATFSLKEALYKAQYPMTQRWLGFEHIQVEPHLSADASYSATLVETPSSPLAKTVRRPLLGRCVLLEDHVLSAVVLHSHTYMT